MRSQQRLKLLKAVDEAFVRAGWTTHSLSVSARDFRVECGQLVFVIKCLDETRIRYDSGLSIVDSLEGTAREIRSFDNRQFIVILDRNFLSMDLGSLIDRGIFALTYNEIGVVTSLSEFSCKPPSTDDKRQAYLLERCLEYAIFVSRLYQKNGDYVSAIKWGHYAVEHSVGYTIAYLSLFDILKAAREFEAAAELGEKIRHFRPDDPQILRGMEDLARKRGNLAEAAQWRARLTEQPTTPRNLADILAKQRQQNPSALPTPGPSPAVETPGPERGLGRLFKAFRRH